MHRTLALILSASLLALCACVTPSYEVLELEPEPGGTLVHRTRGNAVDGDFSLDAQRSTRGDGSVSFALIVHYESSSWFFVREGASLELELDGVPMLLSSRRGSLDQRNVVDGRIVERAVYPIRPYELRRIASASSARMKVHGQKGVRAVSLRSGNQQHLARFLEEYGAGLDQ